MNEKRSSQKPLSRRRFLKRVAGAGLIGLGGYTLWEYAPWLNYAQHAEHERKSFHKEMVMSDLMREHIRYATLAANGHNAQPWKFAIHENAIEIHPDYARRLPIVDPNDREMWISLGCALENLLIAARFTGFASEVTYPVARDVIHVQFTADTPQKTPLFEAIPLRQSTRSEYDGQRIKPEELDQLQSLILEAGVTLRFAVNTADMETTLEYVNQGNLSQYADRAFVDELIQWLRFNKREALASQDGLYARCSGNPEAPRWLGRLFVRSSTPQRQADTDAKKLRSSAGAVAIVSEEDNKTDWVRTGQVCQRLMLKMTSLNIKCAFLNQPIEVASLRSQFQSALHLGASQPQILLRFGYTSPMPRSLRRPIEQVLL